jgi:predicted amidohydrolase YtcJ
MKLLSCFRTALLLGAAFPGWSICAQTGGGEVIFVGGKIVTGDAQGSIAQAVAVKSGRIVAVGSDATIRRLAGPSAKVIELGGKTVLPGLYESHVHALRTAEAELRDPYQELTTIAQIQEWIRQKARQVPPGSWIRVPRNEITRLKEKRHPTVQELDAATTTHPVVFEAVRKYVFNTRGFAEFGITAETKSIPNAEILPGADGKPQFFLTTAVQYTSRFAARDTATAEEKRASLLKLHQTYNSVGITTIFERGDAIPVYRAYEKLKEAGLLTLRTRFTLMYPNAYRSGDELQRFTSEANVRPGMGDDWLSIGLLKIVADGGIHWGNTRLSEPYGERRVKFYAKSDPSYRGDMNYTEEEMTSIFGAAARAGWQMMVHVTGDAGTDAVLQAMENVNAKTPLKDKRFTLTHSYFPTPAIAQRVAALGMCIDTQTNLYYKDSEFIASIYGRNWADRFLGLGTWKRAGVPVAINSDHMVGFDPNHAMNSFNPFLALYIAVSRRSDAGNVYNPDQKLSRLDALRAVTAMPAYLNFEEAKSGTLEAGKYADLIVIDRDYLTCPEEEIRDIKVLRTVVDGRTVYEASGPRLAPNSTRARE